MALETVNFYVVDEDDDALVGVTVRIFDSLGVFVTSQVSALVGSDAIADVTLDGDDPANSYEARFYKFGCSFDGGLGSSNNSPMSFDVYSPASGSPTGTNDFNVQAQTHTLPTAVDSSLCRVSGFVVDHAKNAVENFSIRVLSWDPDETAPAAIRAEDGNLIASKSVDLHTDATGYVAFDLYRCGKYLARLEDQPDVLRELHVPDAPSIKIADLMFPVIRSLTYASSPLALSVGDSVDAAPVIVASDLRTFGPGDNVLTWTSSDEAVATVGVQDDELIITAVGAGTATITAELVDDTVVRLPTEPQSATSLTVNVT